MLFVNSANNRSIPMQVAPPLDQETKKTQPKIRSAVRTWLLIGLFMVFVQVIVGGITRLTDSGLSITEWAVIQGTLPPMNEIAWQDAFDQYQAAASQQYQSLHADMTLSEFKVIFFWEYIHRLWARTMGLVFIFPFLYFLYKKQMPKWLVKRLGLVVALAALAATFGWIMVASGLNDDSRTWVSAYKLVIHLSIATAVFATLFWTYLHTTQHGAQDAHLSSLRRFALGATALLAVQIVFGGLMAGMKAGLIHPYFPLFVEGERLANALQSGEADLVNYESSLTIKAWVHVVHRVTAYVLTAVLIGFFLKIRNANTSLRLQRGSWVMLGLIGLQFALGVLTVINSIGSIPIAYGVMHQGVALLLLISLLYMIFQLKISNVDKFVEN